MMTSEMNFGAVLDFVERLARKHRMLIGLTDLEMTNRIKFSFSYPLQVGALSILRSTVRYSPWYKLVLPYGIKCLYNASEDVSGSIDSILLRKDCFMLDPHRPRERDVVVDVGAYVGLYSILSSMLVGKGGFVIAIEPVPPTFRVLKRNLELNNVKNAVALNLALSGQNGEQDLYVPKVSSAGSSFFLDHLKAQSVKDYGKIRVRFSSFDNLTKKINLKHVDIVKVDVEGAELSVLQGASKSLEKGLIDKLVVEVHKTVNRPEAVADFLRAHGYILDAYFDINGYSGMLYAHQKN